MVKAILSLLVLITLSATPILATYIQNYQGYVLDLAYNDVKDFSVVNSHYINVPAAQNQNVSFVIHVSTDADQLLAYSGRSSPALTGQL